MDLTHSDIHLERLDVPIVTVGKHRSIVLQNGHGYCVSFYSPDDLDRWAVEYCDELTAIRTRAPLEGRVRTLELGSSPLAPQSLRFRWYGAEAHAVDLLDDRYSILARNGVTLHQGDLANSLPSSVRGPFDIIFASRVLSHLRYDAALAVLNACKGVLAPHGRLYLSLTGVNCVDAGDYPHMTHPVQERFATVTSRCCRFLTLTEPLCLYTPDDMRVLLKAAGLTVLRHFASSSGSLKAELALASVPACEEQKSIRTPALA